MKTYIVKVQHDQGIVRIHTRANNAASACDIVKASEGCPDRAILSVQRVDSLARALPSLAPHHSPTEHARAAARIVADIGGAE